MGLARLLPALTLLAAVTGCSDKDRASDGANDTAAAAGAPKHAPANGDATPPASAATAVAAGPGEPARPSTDAKQAGDVAALEKNCRERVAEETGAKVLGTNRIEESEAATAIYVDVQGATAPWRCLGYRDGTVGGVMFTGDEGAL